jgi:PAS domain S-box-containing protein
VIDDEEIDLRTLAKLLKAEGFDVVTAPNGEVGVDALRRRPFEVAVSDLGMPGMGGIQTIAALKAIDPDVEVIIFSGLVTTDSTIAALRQGACDYLTKPVKEEEIRPAVARALERRRGKLIGRDVTEQKKAERALRESEAKLQAIFEGVEVGIFLIDPQTHRIVEANPPALKLVGLEREALVGNLCHRFVCPADCGRCPVTDLGQEVDNSERVLLTATGERRPIIKTVKSVLIAGQPLLLESFVDISARKRAELALSEEEARFRSLFASIPLPTFLIDAETLRYLEVNDAAVSYSGYSRDELLQKGLTDLLLPEIAPRVVSTLQALPPHSRLHDCGRHRLEGGRLVDVEVDVHAMEFRGRKAVLSVIQDVTARKQAEAEKAERHRLATLVADVGIALTRAESLPQGLQQCADILVRSIGAAFARVWTLNDEEKVLELQASAGMYTHIDGGHARVPVGKFKIGLIAMVAGMLHDVGKLILAWKLSERFEKVLEEAREARCPVYQVEERLDGFGHAEIGAYLLGLWGLPYNVVEAVALHHAPNRVPHQSLDTIADVYAANLLAHDLEESASVGPAIYNLNDYQEELATLGVGEMIPEWRAIAAEVPGLMAEVCDV